MTPDRGKRSKGSRKATRPASNGAGARQRDPGPPYVVRWHPDAEAERAASWPAPEKVAMNNAVEKLRAAGPRLPHPHSSAVQGDAGKGFRELRPRSGRSRWRPIYRQVTPDTFVIFAVGPEAEIDKSGFDAAVGRAAKRFDELELD
jgi:hypothetical protein